MIRGRKKALSPTPTANINCSIHNRFDIEVCDALTGAVKQTAQAENIVLNQLWTRLLTPAAYFNYIFFGTGEGTPATADTALFSHLGYKSVVTPTYNYDWDAGWISLRQQCQLSETEYVGQSLTEVGIAYGTSSANLVTHAMLMDMNGNTISIAKTETDIINIYATVFVHWDTAGYDNGWVSIVSSPYNWFLSKYLTGISADSSFGTSSITTIPVKLQFANALMFHPTNQAEGGTMDVVITPTYDAANRKITLTAERLPVASGNTYGYSAVSACVVDAWGSDNVDVPAVSCRVGGSWYAGTSIVGEAVGTGDGSTVDFATAFDLPMNVVIYVDGVQNNAVTVEKVPLAIGDMGRYFEWNVLKNTASPAYTISPQYMTDIKFSYQDAWTYFYNPYHAYGICEMELSAVQVEVSDDQVTWVTAAVKNNTNTSTEVISIAEEHRFYQYWRFKTINSYPRCGNLVSSLLSGKNIHFDTPPAAGAVITADYTTQTIAKDENHVFD